MSVSSKSSSATIDPIIDSQIESHDVDPSLKLEDCNTQDVPLVEIVSRKRRQRSKKSDVALNQTKLIVQNSDMKAFYLLPVENVQVEAEEPPRKKHKSRVTDPQSFDQIVTRLWRDTCFEMTGKKCVLKKVRQINLDKSSKEVLPKLDNPLFPAVKEAYNAKIEALRLSMGIPEKGKKKVAVVEDEKAMDV